MQPEKDAKPTALSTEHAMKDSRAASHDFQAEVDIYRETFVRYAGYANEVGEAFRPLIRESFVNGSYGIAIGYVLLDVFDKARKSHLNGDKSTQVAVTAGDVLLWQMLASVCIPGVTINRITWLSQKVVGGTQLNKVVKRSIPTALGLASIPFIVQPIDNLVHYLMNNSYRKWILR